MIRKVIGGLAALGVIGGASSVVWHDGSATVKVKDEQGVTHTTSIPMEQGSSYSCPAGEQDKVAHYVEDAGRIKITLQGVSPYVEPDRYRRLVAAYNAEVDQYNATLESDCSSG